MQFNEDSNLGKNMNENQQSSQDQFDKDSKKYQNISPTFRLGFIKRVLSRQCTIKEAALEFKIKFSTAKAILQTFKREGRIGKKKTRSRNSALCQIRTSSQDLDVDEKGPGKQILGKKKHSQNQAELQEVIKQMEKELGDGKAEETIQADVEKDISQSNTPIPNNVYQIICMQQQQMASVQLHNQMLQQIISSGPIIDQYKLELQKQKLINAQLMQFIQKSNSAQSTIPQIIDTIQFTFEPQQQSWKDFGIIKEEGQNLYTTPLQSFTNLSYLEKFTQPGFIKKQDCEEPLGEQ